MYDSTDYDYIYLHNSGKENVPVYVGDENAVNPNDSCKWTRDSNTFQNSHDHKSSVLSSASTMCEN
jgi:hypothetical protein